MMYSGDELELPDWVINDLWFKWIDRWVWWQMNRCGVESKEKK